MIRLAIIGGSDCIEGYRHAARRIHCAELAATVDRESDFARLLAETPSDFDAAVSRGRSEAAIAGLCQSAMRAGKHVLILFPRSISHAAAESLVADSNRYRVRTMFGHTSRFLPAIQAVKESLAAGQLGEPGLLRIHRWEARSDSAARDAHDLLRDRLHREVDLACWFFEQAPTAVYALTRPATKLEPHEMDYLQVHLGFARGGMAVIDLAHTLPQGDGYYSLSLFGSQGTAYADDHQNKQLLFAGGRPQAKQESLGSARMNSMLLAQLQEFVAAIEQGRDPLCSGADALRAIQVTDVVAESLNSRRALGRRDDAYVVAEAG